MLFRSGITGQGELEHVPALPGRRQVGRRFMWWLCGGDEYDLVETGLFQGILGDEQVANVNRVECPAENANPLSCHQRHASERNWF